MIIQHESKNTIILVWTCLLYSVTYFDKFLFYEMFTFSEGFLYTGLMQNLKYVVFVPVDISSRMSWAILINSSSGEIEKQNKS